MSEWLWCMDYCKKHGLPPAQKWAWDKAKEEYVKYEKHRKESQMISCNECQNNKCDKNGNTYSHYCSEGHWDRTDEEQDWLHDDDEFEEYLFTKRVCSDFVPK